MIDPSERPAFLNQISSDGLRTARIAAAWLWAEPRPPSRTNPPVHTYTWDPPGQPELSLDREILALVSVGIRPVGTIAVAPWWAAGDGAIVAPSRYPDLAAFAAAFAARYGPGGAFWARYPQYADLAVRDLELWTEANSANFWTRRADAAEYVKALRQVRAAVQAVQPRVRLLASIGWQGFSSYVSQLYALGVRGLIDGIGFHPYAPHAPAIIGLVRQLRATLQSVGDGALPIDVTETGQPRSHDGSPSRRAGEGLVSDEARAGTLQLTGAALARSDCGIGNMLVYNAVGTETDREPIKEGWMGIYERATAKPNATGRAIAAASQHWRAAPSTGLVICGPGATAPADLLELGSTVTHTTPTCAVADIRYGGNPIEGATLTLRVADGRTSTFEIDAFGFGEVCIPDGPPVWEFDVWAEIPGIARSAVWRCPVTDGPCRIVAPPAAGGVPSSVASASQPVPVGGGAAGSWPHGAALAPCGHRLKARLRRITSTRAHLEASAICRTSAARSRYVVSVRRRRATRRVVLRTVWLRTNLARRFQARVRLRQGDRVYVTRAADRATGAPRLVASATVCRYRLTVGLKRVTARRATVRARASCPARAARARYVVSVRRKGSRKRTILTSRVLRTNITRTFVVRVRLRTGDRLYLTRAADRRTGTGRLIASVRFRGR